MNMFLEKTLPYLLAVVACIVWWRYDLHLPSDNAVLGSALTIGAILTGFLATAKAILMALDSEIMRRIRTTNYLDDLVSYLSEAIWFSFGFCFLCLVGYFIDIKSNIYGELWILVGVSAAANFVRVTNIMLKILRKHS